MKALTVRQPWAWAIIAGGKDVENRTAAWRYRGPLAIHAGREWSPRGGESPLIVRAAERQEYPTTYRGSRGDHVAELDPVFTFGAIIGIVDLVDVHVALPEITVHESRDQALASPACCESPWAETAYQERPTGRTRRDIVHLVLANPRPLPVPLYCKGALGLWTVPDEIEP